ncbi:MAG: potassium transporter Kup [Solirubrobacterales bacterium]
MDPDAQTKLPAITLAAIGVVYGDIGTSPLYTLREAFGPAGGLRLEERAVLGVLSLIFWTLIVVVALKYVTVIMRADNRGEGGVLALSTLARRGLGETGRLGTGALVLAIAGASLFYGDGVITPAISVLSAVEGLRVAAPVMGHMVVPAAVVILVGLFLFQRVGTGRVGRWFGPVICVWFGVLGILGLVSIVETPAVLRALSPSHALDFFLAYRWQSFIALGAVVLAVTGSEALYADMGHFGRLPIRIAWFGLVLPGLVLNYFGQGALLLREPLALENPFYHLAPGWAQLPLVVLATFATVIASQAVISGAFSLTRQAVNMGLLPRMEIRHTAEEAAGQVYVPRVNWLLMGAVIALVAGFGSSSAMAAAYGIAVTGAMTIDGILAYVVARTLWRWRRSTALAVFLAFITVDLAFLSANSMKIPAGGWFPLVLAAGVATLMATWLKGRNALFRKIHANAMGLEEFSRSLEASRVLRIPGTAVFLSGRLNVVPRALLHNLKHNQVLHERVVIVTVVNEDVPRVNDQRRFIHRDWGEGIHSLFLRYGFMESVNVPEALARHGFIAPEIEMGTSYFLSREILIPSDEPDLPPWQERIFIMLSHASLSATEFFCLPPNRVVELGTQLRI